MAGTFFMGHGAPPGLSDGHDFAVAGDPRRPLSDDGEIL